MQITKILGITTLLFALGACSSAPKTVVDTTGPTHEQVIAQKEAQIDSLERRLNATREVTHGRKFQSRVDGRAGRLETNRKFLNQKYSELGQARSELATLKLTADEEEFQRRSAQLDNTLVALGSGLEMRAAE